MKQSSTTDTTTSFSKIVTAVFVAVTFVTTALVLSPAVVAPGRQWSAEAFSLQMSSSLPSSSSSMKKNKALMGFVKTTTTKTTKGMSSSTSPPSKTKTKLNYATTDDENGDVVTLPSPPKVTGKIKVKKDDSSVVDPVQSIAFLNDPGRKHKKRCGGRRPLSELNRKRRALDRAVTKARAQARFEFGQRAAQRAIDSVLTEHKIQDADVIMP